MEETEKEEKKERKRGRENVEDRETGDLITSIQVTSWTRSKNIVVSPPSQLQALFLTLSLLLSLVSLYL